MSIALLLALLIPELFLSNVPLKEFSFKVSPVYSEKKFQRGDLDLGLELSRESCCVNGI